MAEDYKRTIRSKEPTHPRPYQGGPPKLIIIIADRENPDIAKIGPGKFLIFT
jgi:hypothetical protein